MANSSKQYDDEMTFILFSQEVEEGSKRPNASGFITINGVKYDIAGWSGESQAGTRFLKGKVSLPKPKEVSTSTKEEAPF
jgi:hypothetical protein